MTADDCDPRPVILKSRGMVIQIPYSASLPNESLVKLFLLQPDYTFFVLQKMSILIKTRSQCFILFNPLGS